MLEGRDEKLLQWITDTGLVVLASDNQAVEVSTQLEREMTAREPGQCLLMWNPHPTGWRHRVMARLANARLGAKLTVGEPVRYVEVAMAMARDRPLRFAYILAQGRGDCR